MQVSAPDGILLHPGFPRGVNGPIGGSRLAWTLGLHILLYFAVISTAARQQKRDYASRGDHAKNAIVEILRLDTQGPHAT